VKKLCGSFPAFFSEKKIEDLSTLPFFYLFKVKQNKNDKK